MKDMQASWQLLSPNQKPSSPGSSHLVLNAAALLEHRKASADGMRLCLAGQHPIPILDMKQLLDLEMALMVRSPLLRKLVCLPSNAPSIAECPDLYKMI